MRNKRLLFLGIITFFSFSGILLGQEPSNEPVPPSTVDRIYMPPPPSDYTSGQDTSNTFVPPYPPGGTSEQPTSNIVMPPAPPEFNSQIPVNIVMPSPPPGYASAMPTNQPAIPSSGADAKNTSIVMPPVSQASPAIEPPLLSQGAISIPNFGSVAPSGNTLPPRPAVSMPVQAEAGPSVMMPPPANFPGMQVPPIAPPSRSNFGSYPAIPGSSSFSMPAAPRQYGYPPSGDILQGFPPQTGFSAIQLTSQTSQPSRFMGLQMAKALRRLNSGVSAIRLLSGDPKNAAWLKKILDIGRDAGEVLSLYRYPPLPMFQIRSDGIVVRDKSDRGFEYRFFGAFQTRLNGWIKSLTSFVDGDIVFEGRGRSKIKMKFHVSGKGPFSGNIQTEATDGVGRVWKLTVEMKEIILRDDGMPSGGNMRLAGNDAQGKGMMLDLNFPCPVYGENIATDTRNVLEYHRKGKGQPVSR